ncbi:MAG: glycosyltransferase 87 family protein, partial [Anaerolineales bacterium]
LMLFLFLGYYSLRSIILGQYAVVNALLVLLSLLAVKRRNDFAAGILLALSLCKPQMVFLFVPWMLIWAFSQRRWDVFGGFFGGGGVILAVSLMFLPDWPLQMLRQILDYPTYTGDSSPLSILASLTPGVKRQLEWILYGGFLGYLIVEWVVAWKKDYPHFFWVGFLTLVVNHLVAYRTATTHFILFYPAMCLVFRILEERWHRFGRWLVWGLLLGWFVGSWWLFLSTVQGNQESSVMFLPFPFLVLLGLWWTRWWQVRPPITVLQALRNRVD